MYPHIDQPTLQSNTGLSPYLDKLTQVAQDTSYSALEASLALPHDPTHLAQARTLLKQLVAQPLKYVVVIGIGGSNLGTQAIYEALQGPHSSGPKLLCLDTTLTSHTQVVIRTLTDATKLEEMIICIVSKSGGTTETIANAEVLLNHLKVHHPHIMSRVVGITDVGSPFEKLCVQEGAHILHLPKLVGGRYSVLSTVGLFPLLCLGIDVEALLAGAKHAVCELAASGAPEMALHLYNVHEQGYAIHDLFLFDGRLEMVGKWYRQLLAESLGKEGKGLLPTVSIGSTDLHSVAQLYLGGKANRYTTFVWVAQEDELTVAKDMRFPILPDLAGRSLGQIHEAIYQSTKAAYDKTGRPHNSIIIPVLDATSLGWLLQTAMIWTMCFGHLLGVNAFDQPAVEIYKQVMRDILKQS